IFELESGFGVDPKVDPWRRFTVWSEDQSWKGKLASLRALFVGVISHSIQATSRFGSLIEQAVRMPEPITDLHYYIRSPFGRWLVNLRELHEQPWESPFRTTRENGPATTRTGESQ